MRIILVMIEIKPAQVWPLLLAAVAGLFLSGWLARSGVLILGEEHLLTWIYGMPEELRLTFLVLTLLGSTWVLAVILIGLLIKSRFDIALRVMLAGLAAASAAALAKELVGRPRPVLLLTEILQRELLVSGNGFPSGHVALATAVSMVLGAYLPKKRRYIVPIWIGVVAVSRLYLGVHAPLDIVGGFCIGLIAAICVLLVFPPHKMVRGIRVAKKHKRA